MSGSAQSQVTSQSESEPSRLRARLVRSSAVVVRRGRRGVPMTPALRRTTSPPRYAGAAVTNRPDRLQALRSSLMPRHPAHRWPPPQATSPGHIPPPPGHKSSYIIDC